MDQLSVLASAVSSSARKVVRAREAGARLRALDGSLIELMALLFAVARLLVGRLASSSLEDGGPPRAFSSLEHGLKVLAALPTEIERATLYRYSIQALQSFEKALETPRDRHALRAAVDLPILEHEGEILLSGRVRFWFRPRSELREQSVLYERGLARGRMAFPGPWDARCTRPDGVSGTRKRDFAPCRRRPRDPETGIRPCRRRFRDPETGIDLVEEAFPGPGNGNRSRAEGVPGTRKRDSVPCGRRPRDPETGIGPVREAPPGPGNGRCSVRIPSPGPGRSRSSARDWQRPPVAAI